MRMILVYLCAGLIGSTLVPTVALACSACGCTLNTDWDSQGLSTSRGWRFDVRFDYFDQNQLRSDSDSVARANLAVPNDREVQQFTHNRNTTFGLDYSPNSNWGFSAQLPWFERGHATIAPGDTEISVSDASGIGDLRLLGRYQGFSVEHDSGVLFGVKLPSGRYTQDFASGPQAGQALDRGLQLGTGTTDLLLGIYKFGAITQDWGYFAQALAQAPMNSRAGFRAGTGINVNAGLRYTASSTLVPQLQINVRAEQRERGANADVENSGATLAYLSPGLTWNLTRRFSAYGFVQLPLYQRVNGLQIEARSLGSVGLHYIF
ncbi:MAG: hypothetical protein ACREPT_15300 [Rudaea sp.]